MRTTYQHTLRYSDVAGARPLFQNYLALQNADSNLNRTTKRYYSSADVSIYFGDFFVDDAMSVGFEVSESAMLLYGYNSYVFDEVAKGARMVQGQFAINFTAANYLSKVLSDISQYKGTGAITHSKFHAMWPVGFDLLILHGSNEHSDTASNDMQVIMLKNIFITGASTQYSAATGDPIAEIYSFVGQDVIFGAELDSEEDVKEDIVLANDDSPAKVQKAYYDSSTKRVYIEFDKEIKIEKLTYRFENDSVMHTASLDKPQDYIFRIEIANAAKDWNEDVVMFINVDYTLPNYPDASFSNEFYHFIVDISN